MVQAVEDQRVIFEEVDIRKIVALFNVDVLLLLYSNMERK